MGGAKPLLEAGRVHLLYFEYNKIGLWRSIDLQETVALLDLLDYGCFFAGQPTLTSISGSCWDPAYEIKYWSNVVCAYRPHFMFKELLAMSWQEV